VLSAIVALAIAWFVEPLVYDVTHSTTLFYAGAGPIEEGGKLLVPFVLLLVGPRIFRDPRVGIWTVVVCGVTFGTAEGIEYLLKADHASVVAGETLAQVGIQEAVGSLVTRAWVELGHVIWTACAAAIIWLAAHRMRRAFTWIGVGAFLIAAALHSINDAVFNQLGRIDRPLGALGVALAIAWMVLGYTLWFRARARQAVPPHVLDLVPKRWVPRLSSRARANAVDATAPEAGDSAAVRR
jgi:RsiW-degrading membrane proteinase PrsW (M82 family)